MTTHKRTDSTNPDFQNLVKLLDADLHKRDGVDHAFYAQFNKIDKIRHAIVSYIDERPVGCGAFKPYDENRVEIKRMYVNPEFRGKGIGLAILQELERWAAELNYSATILETGKRNPEAIRLYEKAGYTIMDNFGQYENVENSICMTKKIMAQGPTA